MCKKLQQTLSNVYLQIWSESDEIQRWWWHGLYFVLDLEFQQEAHDLHRDYPMAPEIIAINKDMLPNAQKDIQKHYSQMPARDEKTKKLVSNVLDNALKPKHDDNIQLVYTDTGSYVSKTDDDDDVYEDLKEISE